MPPKKKVAALVKVQLQAGQANPAPPVGTALGPHGVNIMEFCKAYNAETESLRGNVIPVEITIYEDRSFSFITKTPPAAELIKKAAGLSKGSVIPHKDKVGAISKDQIREIAETKMQDLSANDVDAAMKIVEGTARSIGVCNNYPCARVGGPARPANHIWYPVKKVTPVMNQSTIRSNKRGSKAYRAAAAKIDSDTLYTPHDAITLAQETKTGKFDASIDVA